MAENFVLKCHTSIISQIFFLPPVCVVPVYFLIRGGAADELNSNTDVVLEYFKNKAFTTRLFQ